MRSRYFGVLMLTAAVVFGMALNLVPGCAPNNPPARDPDPLLAKPSERVEIDAGKLDESRKVIEAEAEVVRPQYPQSAERFVVQGRLMGELVEDLKRAVTELREARAAVAEQKAEKEKFIKAAAEAKTKSDADCQKLKDELKAEKESNARRGTWLLYLFLVGGIAGVGVGVFLAVQGLSKAGIGLAVGSASVSALCLLFLRYGNWIMLAVGAILLCGVAYLVIMAIRKYRASITTLAASFDEAEQAALNFAGQSTAGKVSIDMIKGKLADSQLAAGVKDLVNKARGK